MIEKLKGYLHRKWFDKKYNEKFAKVTIELDTYNAMDLAAILINIKKENLHEDYKVAINQFNYQLAKSITNEQIEDVKARNSIKELVKKVNSGAN
jgi:hypothetical protein